MNKCTCLITGLLMLTTLVLSTSFAQPVSPEKRTEIERTIQLIGAEEQLKIIVADGVAALRANAGDRASARFVAKFEEKFTVKAFLEHYVIFYDKHFTLQDIRDLNKFYELPLGVKFVAMQTAMQRLNAEATNKFAAEAATEAALE